MLVMSLTTLISLLWEKGFPPVPVQRRVLVLLASRKGLLT